jgi:hypothetical protein
MRPVWKSTSVACTKSHFSAMTSRTGSAEQWETRTATLSSWRRVDGVAGDGQPRNGVRARRGHRRRGAVRMHSKSHKKTPSAVIPRNEAGKAPLNLKTRRDAPAERHVVPGLDIAMSTSSTSFNLHEALPVVRLLVGTTTPIFGGLVKNGRFRVVAARVVAIRSFGVLLVTTK